MADYEKVTQKNHDRVQAWMLDDNVKRFTYVGTLADLPFTNMGDQ